jgi:hypothetical protein
MVNTNSTPVDNDSEVGPSNDKSIMGQRKGQKRVWAHDKEQYR